MGWGLRFCDIPKQAPLVFNTPLRKDDYFQYYKTMRLLRVGESQEGYDLKWVHYGHREWSLRCWDSFLTVLRKWLCAWDHSCSSGITHYWSVVGKVLSSEVSARTCCNIERAERTASHLSLLYCQCRPLHKSVSWVLWVLLVRLGTPGTQCWIESELWAVISVFKLQKFSIRLNLSWEKATHLVFTDIR